MGEGGKKHCTGEDAHINNTIDNSGDLHNHNKKWWVTTSLLSIWFSAFNSPLGFDTLEVFFGTELLLVCGLSLYQFSSVQSLSPVPLFATPSTAAHQASLSFTNSPSLLKLMFIELVMPSNHLILCRPLLLLPSNLSQHQGLFKWVSSSHQVAIAHLRTIRMCSCKIPVKQDWNPPAIIIQP